MIKQEMTIPLHIIGTITVADNKWPWEAPYAGRVIQLKGTIKTLGSGAGTSTDFQLRNVTQAKDILSTVGAFEVNSATNRLEGQVVNFTNCSFVAADVITPDCDAISTNPADVVLYMTVVLYIDDL